MMKKRSFSSFQLHRLHLYPPLVQLVKFVVFLHTLPSSLSNNQSRPLPSPAPSPSLSTIRDIREIRSFSNIVPSPLSNNQSPPPLRLHRLPFCPPFVTFEKFVVFQIKSPPPCQIISPLHPLSSVSFLYVFTIGAISEIRSLVSISAF